MTATRNFRFGLISGGASSPTEWVNRARQAEAKGFSTLLMPDTMGRTLAPIPALAIAAASTSNLRLGTYVQVNDFRNPVLTARDSATLHVLSGGRFELGLGVGRPGVERDFRSLGIPSDPGGLRVTRLAGALRIIRALFRGEKVTASESHYHPTEAELFPPLAPGLPLPILVAGSGRRMLSLATQEADIVALGTRAESGPDALMEMIEVVRQAAGERLSEIELNLSLAVAPEDDGIRQRMRQMLRWFGADLDQMIESNSPTVVTGSPEQMAEQLLERRQTFGVSYLTVPDFTMGAFAPVVERLAHM
jgi:probable F420-dependent oxidoreductase